MARLHKDWDKGNTSLGGMMTSTHRFTSDSPLASFLPGDALTAGIDFTRHFANRAFVLAASGLVSQVTGDPESIRALETSPSTTTSGPTPRTSG